ncbi:MAG: ABC transporter ATP-binding protein [Myxococcota bacterium]
MIQVNNLTRYYGSFPALRDVSFDVKEGEIIGLLGLNGAGKSTALQILAGVLAPSSGRVQLNGRDVTDNADELKASIGFLPEEPPLYRDMRVGDFLVYCAQLKGMSGSVARGRLPVLLHQTGLSEREKQVIGTLSHGYKKRVGIAMAVIHNPKLVILDEPISGLDPKQIKDMRAVIKGLSKGRAVLLSSHILSEISRTCDRLLFLKDGRLVASGNQADLVAPRSSAERMVLTARADGAKLSEWLTAHASVASATQLEADGDGLVRFDVSMNGDDREQLIPELAAAGFGVRLIEEPTLDLEETFLGLTGGAA